MAVTIGNSSKGTVKPAAKTEKSKSDYKPKKNFFSNKSDDKEDVKTEKTED